MQGVQYNKLTGLIPAWQDHKSQWHWLFECDCGVLKVINAVNVRNGQTRSCGCALKGHSPTRETRIKMRDAKLLNPTLYWKGKKRLEVLSWLTPFKKQSTPWNKGKKLPQFSGALNPCWIQDRTKIKSSDKKHLDGRYREWMFAVKNRDRWKCKISNGDCSGRLEAHHILRWSDHPELRYEINNGITLCHAHHPHKRVDERRMEVAFRELISVQLQNTV